jgi:glutamyl-Q tRNA(Asp) synthetase
VRFEDRVQGPIEQDVAAEVGDFVLKRRDGLHAYQLAVVVDDAHDQVTDVVRGADLLLSTPRQILLQRALGLPTPRYFHVPIATNAQGEKLSKQTRAAPIDASHPEAVLRDALEFFGQPAPGPGERGKFAAAVRAWIPRGSPSLTRLVAKTEGATPRRIIRNLYLLFSASRIRQGRPRHPMGHERGPHPRRAAAG